MEGLGKLASGIAHDFNNLLTVIDCCGSLISERMEPDHPLQKYAREILQASELAGGFTRQLLAFSRRQAVEFNPIDLNRVVEETAKMLRRMVGEKVELVLRLEPSPGTILADSGQLQQALLNLAVNAKDVMPNGGRLVIETASVRIDGGFDGGFPGAPPGHYLRLSVSDTGIGMDAETKRQIFEPFFTTKAPGRGTGLGLSIVYRIVRACNGRIAVSSELGKGATFSMIFPSIEAPVCEPQRPEGTSVRDRRVER
jgi:signal transduction histidine kinase